MQTELLSLNRSSLYYQPRPVRVEEVQLKHRIDEIYTQSPFYGARKIAAQLQREGMGINRKTVGRYMQEMGIAAIYPGPNLSKRNQKEGVYPYLLRHISSAYPNHIWGIDITYIRLSGGWMYLVAILDWYSRYVVSWELDQTLGTAVCLVYCRACVRTKPFRSSATAIKAAILPVRSIFLCYKPPKCKSVWMAKEEL